MSDTFNTCESPDEYKRWLKTLELGVYVAVVDTFNEVRRVAKVSYINSTGRSIIADTSVNKGTAFSTETGFSQGWECGLRITPVTSSIFEQYFRKKLTQYAVSDINRYCDKVLSKKDSDGLGMLESIIGLLAEITGSDKVKNSYYRAKEGLEKLGRDIFNEE